MRGDGRNQTVISDPSSPYLGRRPSYSYYDGIGNITVRTRDFPVSSTVSVTMIIGYDEGDQNMWQELNNRRFELRDFVRLFFSSKTAAELAPERDAAIKSEIREMLNTRFLDSRGARNILFDRLDINTDL
jgi:flagellar FliL protein